MAIARRPEGNANTVAEAVRKYNHATVPTPRSRTGSLHYPGQAYSSVAAFKQMAQMLPQAFDQTSGFLTRLHHDGHLTADHGTVEDHVFDARQALTEAAHCADMLAEALNRAHNAVAPLGYSGPIDE
ncbi:hypothetical protein ACFVFQ_08860 [Streptomyces sp. NPDC057743]|uniref:hypothetical protein n=1 Tax=Streptomyces sp. NPDC057743 TaxID=3346236 RepID=UPI0036B5E13F